MKAKFIGDPTEGPKRKVPEVHSAYGIEFPEGKFVEVPDELAAKFAGNNHYETSGKQPEVEPPTPAPVMSGVPVIPPAGPVVPPPK